MPENKTTRYGAKVTVTIKKGRGKEEAKKAPDRRYGPPPMGLDVRKPTIKPLITLHDMSQIFEQKVMVESLEASALTGQAYHDFRQANYSTVTDNSYWTEMYYASCRVGFIGGEVDDANLVSQNILRPLFPRNPDPMLPSESDIHIFNEEEVYRLGDTPEPENRIVYRKNDKCWPLGKEVEALGVTLTVGATNIPIGGTGWDEKPQKAEVKEAEVALFTMPVPLHTNAWGRGNRDLYSKPGAARKGVRSGSQPIKVVADGYFYESFDSADTENYKVTAEASYSADAVSSSFNIGRDQVRVFLVPQIWKYAYADDSIDLYEFARTLPTQKHFRYVWFSVTTVLGAIDQQDKPFNHDRHANFREDTMVRYFYQDKLDFLTLPIAATSNPRTSNTPDQIGILVHSQVGDAAGRATVLLGHRPETGAVVVTNTQTEEGRLVGAVKIKDSKYYVWRKTVTEREIINLYAGDTAPIYANVQGLGVPVSDSGVIPGDIPTEEYEITEHVTAD